MNCLRIILDMFALTKANIFDPFANKIDQSQYLNIAKVGTELGNEFSHSADKILAVVQRLQS